MNSLNVTESDLKKLGKFHLNLIMFAVIPILTVSILVVIIKGPNIRDLIFPLYTTAFILIFICVKRIPAYMRESWFVAASEYSNLNKSRMYIDKEIQREEDILCTLFSQNFELYILTDKRLVAGKSGSRRARMAITVTEFSSIELSEIQNFSVKKSLLNFNLVSNLTISVKNGEEKKLPVRSGPGLSSFIESIENCIRKK